MHSIVRTNFHLVSMSYNQELHPHFLSFIVHGLFISPRDYLMAVNYSYFRTCELHNLNIFLILPFIMRNRFELHLSSLLWRKLNFLKEFLPNHILIQSRDYQCRRRRQPYWVQSFIYILEEFPNIFVGCGNHRSLVQVGPFIIPQPFVMNLMILYYKSIELYQLTCINFLLITSLIDYYNQVFQKMTNHNKIAFCCFDYEENEEEEEQKRIPSDQNIMPMLRREESSKVRFSNISKRNIQPIYELLLQLYQNPGKSQTIFNILSKKRINPDFGQIGQRDDLEYYVPQLITYLVIQENLQDQNLIQLILQACVTDFYFAHSVYFYLNSFSSNWMNQEISNVIFFIQKHFKPRMGMYSNNRLSGIQFTKAMLNSEMENRENLFLQVPVNDKPNLQNLVYGTIKYPDPAPENPDTVKSIQKMKYHEHGFMETPTFWEDLITIGEDISSPMTPQERVNLLDNLIKTRVNTKLPASVYIPFFKDKIRMYTILCVWKGRIFSTKQRAPFSIWLQIYREQQQLQIKEQAVSIEIYQEFPKKTKKQKILDKIYQTISKPFTISQHKNTLNIKQFIINKFSSIEQRDESSRQEVVQKRAKFKSFYQDSLKQHNRVSLSEIYQNKSDGKKSDSRISQNSDFSIQNQKQQTVQIQQDFFPQRFDDQIAQFKKKSVYRHLKSWKIVHLMVKIGDDLKQEQFAMQLINNFDKIFKKQKIDCAVFPYQVISLGPSYGLIQMLNDITTLDSLYKKLKLRKMTLKGFFQQYYKQNKISAKKNFMKSLAGYSLITYFLQVKDRHNGNILLHRDGYIIHIDFGFFLSNAPGKGVQLQSKVPFKLLSQYVQVIGQLSSESFFQFRQLFYKGFMAIIKHKQSILSLVKMMYSSHGQTMGCFIKSQEALAGLQRRLNPGQDLQQFCYNLINSSLDNWRSKWYDKFQYFLQKIYY